MFYKCKNGMIINLHQISTISDQTGTKYSESSEVTFSIYMVNGTSFVVVESDFKKIQKLILDIK